MASILADQPLLQSSVNFATVEDEDVDLPSYNNLSLEFRSAKYGPYFRQALELDNHKYAGDDEIGEDDRDRKYDDGRKSRTITPGDSQENPIILDDVPENNDGEDDPKKDNRTQSDSLSPRPEDVLQMSQGDVGEDPEQPRRALLHPSVEVIDAPFCSGKLNIHVERKQHTPEGPPPTQPADMQLHPATDTSPGPDEPSMKRSRLFTDADVPCSKRSRRTRVETHKAREARVARVAAVSEASFESKRLGHAIPRYCRDKDWEIDDLDDVDMATDGSLWCIVKWKPTTLNAKTLVGEAVEKRLKELVTEKYGAEAWENGRLS